MSREEKFQETKHRLAQAQADQSSRQSRIKAIEKEIAQGEKERLQPSELEALKKQEVDGQVEIDRLTLDLIRMDMTGIEEEDTTLKNELEVLDARSEKIRQRRLGLRSRWWEMNPTRRVQPGSRHSLKFYRMKRRPFEMSVDISGVQSFSEREVREELVIPAVPETIKLTLAAGWKLTEGQSLPTEPEILDDSNSILEPVFQFPDHIFGVFQSAIELIPVPAAAPSVPRGGIVNWGRD